MFDVLILYGRVEFRTVLHIMSPNHLLKLHMISWKQEVKSAIILAVLYKSRDRITLKRTGAE